MKALVVGSAHLDIIARPLSNSEHKDRIGRISLEAGGTACNVAFDMCKLGHPVRLLTAWGTSPIERLMASHIESTGVELLVDEVPDMPLAAFSALLTIDGDLESAVSSTPVDTHKFSNERIEEALHEVDYVVIEANLNPEVLAVIAAQAQNKGLPVFALAVSEDKVDRLRHILHLLKLAFMNSAECERLMLIVGVVDPCEIAETYQVDLFVTRGDRGAMVYLQNGERIRIQPPVLADINNLLGVGDAFSVGVIDGIMQHELSYVAAAVHAHALVGDIAKSGACNAFSLNALSNMVSRLYADARNDKLTGLLRRAAFDVEYAKHQGGWSNTLIVIDCDHFKNVNDTLGHQTGDSVLQGVANVIQTSIRGWDISCRWGGDEFVVLLPRTALAAGKIVAERIRSTAAEAPLHGVTLSIGVATSGKGEMLASVIERADSAMYAAKRAGKNKIIVA